jgi:hypothetical protein
MSQTKAENHPFWSGFSFGLLAGGAILYFFATPKGRKNLTTFLEHAELLEKDVSGLLEVLKDQASEGESATRAEQK